MIRFVIFLGAKNIMRRPTTKRPKSANNSNIKPADGRMNVITVARTTGQDTLNTKLHSKVSMKQSRNGKGKRRRV